MRRMWPIVLGATTWSVALAANQPTATAPAYRPALNNGDVVVFLGDDLTETPRSHTSFLFPTLVETFVTVRYPDLRVRWLNVGWRGDTVRRALLRLKRDVLAHRPTKVVICLGLNDPQYLPLSEERLEVFRRDLTYLVEQCRESGAKTWLISPPSIEEETGRPARIMRESQSAYVDLTAIQYNRTVGRYAEEVRRVASATESGFVDWYALTSIRRQEIRRSQPNFGFTRDGYMQQARGHALVAAALLRTWGAEPIQTTVELNWETGATRLETHSIGTGTVLCQEDQEGARILRMRGLPMPWPMPAVRPMGMQADWEAADMCQIILRIPDPPPAGVILTCEEQRGTAGREIVDASRLRSGVNLATTEPLRSLESVSRLLSYIGTKNLRWNQTWRMLELTPPSEPELTTAHHKLIDAYNEYVRGYETIIAERPKTFDLTLSLRENSVPESLPASRPAPARPVGTRPAPQAEGTSRPAE